MKLTKKLASIAATGLMAAALVLAGCGNQGAQATSAAADGSANITTLTVGFDKSYPPYGFMDQKTGEYTGFDLELAKEVCKRNNWELALEPIDWDAKDSLLNSGEITCIWNGFTLEGREDDYTFSDPYMLNGQVVVVKKDSGIKSLADLKGKVVITQTDSAALDLLQGDKKDVADTFKKLETIGDYNTAFMRSRAS